ncbi:hypothetical protein CVU83_01725 [Candidatus Falkowbacteria bacterium HGW-Falkowbacteria-2]|uniref:Uncharacterized protein n=1 Tax=Candidatus Falkowbacteria bacterium HGW-Falkowbacteria-2 TaxID=2013769 RepID=A0A2N2E151_9BACT|nr:MAG: hypothetical protein CVU83_01725 [Candidatus Falkowbacteria bacterium HGW-Falkowbacteria-2]
MEKEELKNFYLSLIPGIREVARKSGYAIGIHGSLTRDLDIIGAPWVDNCVGALTLVKRVAKKLDAYYQTSLSKKPHGRKCYVIFFKFMDGPLAHAYIDFSIYPKIK